jgi:phenylalanyl-tRNA synthetase beta chain
MPTVEFSLKDLQKLLGVEIPYEELEERGILFAKGEIESFFDGQLRVDIKDTNRPDLWSVEGIARELKGHYGIEEGLPNYEVKESDVKMIVEAKVEEIRPKTVGAVVTGLEFDDEAIRQTIQLQEKIHQTYGRNRELVAIGVYDYDKIIPPIRYTTVKPDGIRFVPLDFDRELTPREILKLHPKGREYGHLINKFDEYPLMIDSKNNVLSIPPIINSAYTGKVTPETENVFIEMTGKKLDRLMVALNVIVAAFHDRGGEVHSIKVVYPQETIVTPDFTPKKFEMDIKECRRILGLDLAEEEIIRLLRKSRYNAYSENGKIQVEYSPIRDDIMHQRDIIEDVAIAYDINKIEPEPPMISTIGKEDEKEEFCNSIREIMIGLGLQEILTFSLTNKDYLFKRMNIEEEKVCEIENPISANWTTLRNWLIPSLIEFLSYNLHVEYPQKIFEIGDVVQIDETQETYTRTIKKLACAITDSKVSYEDISSILDALLYALGLDYKLAKIKHPSFIPGRVARISIKEHTLGVIGEIHPQVLNNWTLEKPLCAFELDIDKIFYLISK